jgi:hypothetical protein
MENDDNNAQKPWKSHLILRRVEKVGMIGRARISSKFYKCGLLEG